MRTEMVLGDGVLGSFLNLKLRFFCPYDSVPRAHYIYLHLVIGSYIIKNEIFYIIVNNY